MGLPTTCYSITRIHLVYSLDLLLLLVSNDEVYQLLALVQIELKPGRLLHKILLINEQKNCLGRRRRRRRRRLLSRSLVVYHK